MRSESRVQSLESRVCRLKHLGNRQSCGVVVHIVATRWLVSLGILEQFQGMGYFKHLEVWKRSLCPDPGGLQIDESIPRFRNVWHYFPDSTRSHLCQLEHCRRLRSRRRSGPDPIPEDRSRLSLRGAVSTHARCRSRLRQSHRAGTTGTRSAGRLGLMLRGLICSSAITSHGFRSWKHSPSELQTPDSDASSDSRLWTLDS